MPWTKLKNIILLILLLTNICLLGLVVSQSLQTSHQEQQTRENTVRFLTERGVQVEEKILPQSAELLPMITERDLEGEKTAAAALLQGEVETEPRGGEVYRYSNDRGSVQFHGDGTFSVSLEPGTYPVTGELEEACAAVLAVMGFQGEVLKCGEEEVSFCQSWNEIPLFSQKVSVVCTEGSVSAISGGRCLMGASRVDTTRETITVSTALVRLLNGISALGDVCSRIDSIEQGYVCSATLSGTMTMTPVWQVTTDTGAYQLDMVTGAVKRAE